MLYSTASHTAQTNSDFGEAGSYSLGNCLLFFTLCSCSASSLCDVLSFLKATCNCLHTCNMLALLADSARSNTWFSGPGPEKVPESV